MTGGFVDKQLMAWLSALILPHDTYIQRHTLVYTLADKQTNRQTDRQTDTQTDTLTDRQTDRQTDTDIHSP
jgi:hypothetical protein